MFLKVDFSLAWVFFFLFIWVFFYYYYQVGLQVILKLNKHK